MNDKDKILKAMVSNPNINSVFTPESLNKEILTELHRDEVEFLMKEILREKPELLNIEKTVVFPFAVSPTGLINSFLSKGGFTKIEYDIEIERTKRTKREENADRLLELDLKLKRFESKIGKKLIIAGTIIAFLSFLITVLTLEFWNNYDNKTKQEPIEVDQQLNKRQAKTIDTLN